MPFTLSPDAKFTGFSDTGVIVPGGKLHSFAAGSSTPLSTFIDSAGTPNTNPVILDSAARATIYLGAFTYKFVFTDASDVQLWTQDNVSDYALTAVTGDLVGTDSTQVLTNKTLNSPTINFGTLNSVTINNPVVTTGTFTGPSIADPIFITKVQYVKRAEWGKGANVASASTLTLGDDGNVFAVTGNVTINHITTTNWQAGSVIILIFTGTLAITHNAGTVPANTAPVLLSGGVNLGTGDPVVLQLVFDGAAWQQVGIASANHA